MTKLFDVFESHNGRGCGKWDNYPEIYEKHLEKFVGKEVTIFELGVCKGGSLQVWKKYFGEKANIIGVDVDPYSKYEEEQIAVYTGNVLDIELWKNIVERHGQPDIIIDDASHIQQEVIAAFSLLYPALKDGGVYIIEDTHTAYRGNFGGGVTSPYNVVSIFGRMVNDVNVHFIEEPYTRSLIDVKSMHFYPSMLVLEKEWTESPKPLFFGDERYKNEMNRDEQTPMQINPHSNQEVTQQSSDVPASDSYKSYTEQEWKKIKEDFMRDDESNQSNQSNQFSQQKETNQEDIFKWNV